MNTQSNAVHEFAPRIACDAPAVISEARRCTGRCGGNCGRTAPSMSRLWPLAAVFLLGFLISTDAYALEDACIAGKDRTTCMSSCSVMRPCGTCLMGTMILVAVFYCLEALHSERRDRSILFWKSLPISDLTTVLSKALVAVVLLPLFAFAMTCALWFVMVSFSSVVLLVRGTSVATIASQFSIFQLLPPLLYHLLGIHGFGMRQSTAGCCWSPAWARRAPFLWATLPPLAIGVVEKLAFQTSYFAGMLSYVFSGSMDDGMKSKATGMYATLIPRLGIGEFLTSPGLWVGLAVTAIFLAIAVRMRRSQGPI